MSADGKPWSADELRRKLSRFVAEHVSPGFNRQKVCLRRDETIIRRAGFAIFSRPARSSSVPSSAAALEIRATPPGAPRVCFASFSQLARRSIRPEIDRAVAFVRLDNLASRRILQKIGMNADGTWLVDGVEDAFDRLDRLDWRGGDDPNGTMLLWYLHDRGAWRTGR
ncbi:MAG: hypothetical protein JSR91_09765 [Proteobacteria bacterium]|nr:hypothetical protein [Pseudomonadota bacterium]